MDLCCRTDFSLVVASRGYSCCDAQTSHCSSVSCCRTWALELRFSSYGTRTQFLGMWDLPWPGIELCALHCQADPLSLSHQDTWNWNSLANKNRTWIWSSFSRSCHQFTEMTPWNTINEIPIWESLENEQLSTKKSQGKNNREGRDICRLKDTGGLL